MTNMADIQQRRDEDFLEAATDQHSRLADHFAGHSLCRICLHAVALSGKGQEWTDLQKVASRLTAS